MDTKLVGGNEAKEESSSKRAGDDLEQEPLKKQKMEDDKEIAELQSTIEVIPDEEEVEVDAIPLATNPPSIVDWNIIKEGKISYYQIIRADGNSKRYPLTPATITEMLNKKLQSDHCNEMCY
ncbi:hypothetical protein Tco_0037933 [Tanacetum coccineum]